MKWNKQRAGGAAGPPPAPLSPSRTHTQARWSGSRCRSWLLRRLKIGKCRSPVFFYLFICFCNSKVNLDGFRNERSSRNMYELVVRFQKAVSLLISCFSSVLRGCERIKKRDEPGSFYTLEPDSWSPARGKERGQATHHFPSMDTDISELSGH